MDLDNNIAEVVENNETVSEEMQEVAAPVEVETSEETQEVAAPVKSEADAAFAEMRRQNQALAQEKEAAEQAARELTEALGLYFEGESPEDLAIKAKANYEQRSPEELKAEIEAQKQQELILKENQTLKEQLNNIRVEKMMAESLSAIQALDPSVKSLDELGSDFADYIRAGLSTEQAYYATKSREIAETPTPPKAIGEVKAGEAEKDYFTSDEVDNMSQDEIRKNLEKIKASMARW